MCSPCAHHPPPPVVSRYSIISLLIPLLPLPLQLRPRDGPSLSVDPKLCRVPQPQVFLYVRLLRGLASLPTPPLLHASRVTHRAAARQSVLSPTCVRRGPRASIPVHRPEGCSGRCSRRAPRRCPQMLPLCFIIQGHHRGEPPRGIIQGHHPRKDRLQCFIPVLHTGGALPTLDISASLGGPKSQGQRILLGPMLPMLHDEGAGLHTAPLRAFGAMAALGECWVPETISTARSNGRLTGSVAFGARSPSVFAGLHSTLFGGLCPHPTRSPS